MSLKMKRNFSLVIFTLVLLVSLLVVLGGQPVIAYWF